MVSKGLMAGSRVYCVVRIQYFDVCRVLLCSNPYFSTVLVEH